MLTITVCPQMSWWHNHKHETFIMKQNKQKKSQRELYVTKKVDNCLVNMDLKKKYPAASQVVEAV